ncbi:hypothetical protein Noda2021_09520 [Candidatus Dependentiae bacterium Noda2021]|nr:hypothetical protein Noda2021_09520 [Candidatus Dependentiae bacterium Noda2021]
MLKHNLLNFLLLFNFITLSAEIPRTTQKDAYYERWRELLTDKNTNDLSKFKGEIPYKIQQIIEDIKNKTKNNFSAYIFHGPPGNGKSLLAKAIAKEVNGTYLSINSFDIFGRYPDTGPQRVERLFDHAKELSRTAPVIIAIEHIDYLVISELDPTDEYYRNYFEAYKKLLLCIDSLKDYNQIIVIGTSHNKRIFKSKLIQPGRAEIITFNPPDRNSRKAILKKFVQKHPNTVKEKVFNNISNKSIGFSAADLAEVVEIASVDGAINDKNLNRSFEKIFQDEKKRKAAIRYQTFMNSLTDEEAELELQRLIKLDRKFVATIGAVIGAGTAVGLAAVIFPPALPIITAKACTVVAGATATATFTSVIPGAIATGATVGAISGFGLSYLK